MKRKSFLAKLQQSNLLSAGEYAKVLAHSPESDKASTLARRLVNQGVLTRFQAEMLLAGRTAGFVVGQYRILEQLGRGGMGRVFKAIHRTMNRVVALKVISSSLMKNERGRRMFLHEVRAMSRLMHPNIVTAFDANEIDERLYLVMEYVDGPDLETWVKHLGPLPIAQACDFVRQVSLGLEYAHDLGMVHRDIKPSNLLAQPCAPSGYVVKILDFGLARLCASLQDSTPGNSNASIDMDRDAVAGTPDFIAPEQAENVHAADIRSDLYSLGCTFYFLLTGQVPFPGEVAMEKLIRHLTEEPVAIGCLRSDVPRAVNAIIRQLMAKKPQDRFQTPAEVVAALEPFSAPVSLR